MLERMAVALQDDGTGGATFARIVASYRAYTLRLSARWIGEWRARINDHGDATRPIFGLLTPTTLTDKEVYDRCVR